MAAQVTSRYTRQVALKAYRELMNRLLERERVDHRESVQKAI